MKRILFCVLLCFVTGCTSPLSSGQALPPASGAPEAVEATAIPTPTSFALQLQGGNLVRVDLSPDARSTEAAPTMTVAGLIVDVATGEKIKGAVYLGEKLVVSDADQFTLVLPGELEEWLIIKAEGYHEWKVRMRYRVLHHKNMQVPVQLVPLTQPAPPASQI